MLNVGQLLLAGHRLAGRVQEARGYGCGRGQQPLVDLVGAGRPAGGCARLWRRSPGRWVGGGSGAFAPRGCARSPAMSRALMHRLQLLPVAFAATRLLKPVADDRRHWRCVRRNDRLERRRFPTSESE